MAEPEPEAGAHKLPVQLVCRCRTPVCGQPVSAQRSAGRGAEIGVSLRRQGHPEGTGRPKQGQKCGLIPFFGA
eukprot:77711-Prymnesium_polylepis.1